MSSEQHGHGNTGAHSAAAQGQDDVDYGKVIMVGIGSLLLFAVSIAWAGKIWKDEIAATEGKTGREKPVETTRTEIGIVDQVPFVSDTRLARWHKERAAHLEGYGWVDRGKGIVHIPIEEAMAKVAGGVMPAGAPK